MTSTIPRGAALSLALLERAYGRVFSAAQRTNAQSVLDALTTHGDRFGLLQPHRLVQFLAQLMHESGGFAHDRELWGPTPAQERYEGRKDLGNVRKGDGARFRGRGPGQVTGRANYRAFSKWAKKIDFGAPDFENHPEAVNTEPWEGLSAMWYWDEGNPDAKSLNRLADRGDVENITRKWNGGLNGYDDRLRYLDRLSLAFLGYGMNDMPKFQRAAGLKDTSGASGPLTRAALHKALLKLSAPHELGDDVATAPVVEEVPVTVEVPVPVEKPVVPEKVETKVKEKSDWWTKITAGGGLASIGLGWLSGMDWQAILAGGVVLLVIILVLLLMRSQIIAAVRQIKAEVAE